MTISLLSLALGAAAALVVGWAIRNEESGRRVRRAAVVGLPAIAVLTAWALWQNTFPATFGPFVGIMLVIAVAGNGSPGGS